MMGLEPATRTLGQGSRPGKLSPPMGPKPEKCAAFARQEFGPQSSKKFHEVGTEARFWANFPAFWAVISPWPRSFPYPPYDDSGLVLLPSGA